MGCLSCVRETGLRVLRVRAMPTPAIHFCQTTRVVHSLEGLHAVCNLLNKNLQVCKQTRVSYNVTMR